MSNRLARKKAAERTLGEIFDHPDSVLVIHYSCESFYDRPEGASPRVTSIAVRFLASGQTVSFSIHQRAEELGIPYEDIPDRYEEVERAMLSSFSDFVGERLGHHWVHWNMRDINYGFPALEHRARVLDVEPRTIPDSYKIDLARVLIDLYGVGYAAHPRLTDVLDRNKISRRDFLSGAEEAEAFEAGQYVKLHLSTLRKVDVIAALAERAEAGDLETRSSWWERNGASVAGAVEWASDSWVVRGAGLLAIAFGLIRGVMWLVGSLGQHN